jgi:hypothetical protein
LNVKIRTMAIALVMVVISLPAVAGERDVLAAKVAEDIKGARINLRPWGAHLGFEMEIGGDDSGLAALVSVIRSAEPARGHKCANRGAIRFRMSDGGVVAVGLLPSHGEGFYNLSFYVGERLQGVYRVDRAPFLAALDELGVPVDDPAFNG